MNPYKIVLRGIAAGFVATCALSALMLTKDQVPQLDTVRVLDMIARDFALAAGLPTPLAGWLWHFVVGALVWGWMYAVMRPILPGSSPWRKGLYFGFIAALLAWLIALPLAGAESFRTRIGLVQPLVTLLQHLIYGIVLAVVYERLRLLGTTAPKESHRA